MSGHMAPPDTHGRAAGSDIVAPTLIVDIINVSWRILTVFAPAVPYERIARAHHPRLSRPRLLPDGTGAGVRAASQPAAGPLMRGGRRNAAPLLPPGMGVR